jgi:hypothetical protein
MKKQIVVLLLGVVSVLLLSSWEMPKPRVVAIGGLNVNNITGSDSWKTSLGFQLGACVPLISFSESLILRPEINFSLQGAAWEEPDFSGRTDLWYLNIPIVMRYQHSSGFFGEAGLQPGFLLSAKDKYDGNSYDYKEYIKTFDFAIPLGVGYEFDNNLGVGIRVIPGLTDISTEDYGDHNLVVALRVSYIFGKE